jgi:hypothetical protein
LGNGSRKRRGHYNIAWLVFRSIQHYDRSPPGYFLQTELFGG